MNKSGGGPKSLATLVPKLTRTAVGKYGFAEAGLLTDWPALAGQEIAAHAQPERLEFPRGERRAGTLHLRVESAWALAVQHLEPQLIERINGSLGYQAVARLKLRQGPLSRKQERPKTPGPTAVDPAARAALAAQVSMIEDEELRRTVERLGLALLATAQEGR